ncbi:MAG: phosphatase PAP2 family protein [Acetatifactor sp.]|nr:phosphatase PAP2 family protein [Acetatifactor sp.]
MKKCFRLCIKYKHVIPLLIFMVVYLCWFAWLEQDVTTYTVIHMALDDIIPFCEVFIVPYLLWFLYVAAVVAFLMFKNKQDYYKVCTFLMTGMTVFLIISTLWPNGHQLRPAMMPRDNVFSSLVSMLWRTDTPTNLWPSIHVYNSLGAHFAVMHNRELANKKGLKIASLVLAVSIILSTMLIKQHSVFDVVTGLLLGAVMYVVVYRRDWITASRPQRTAQHD